MEQAFQNGRPEQRAKPFKMFKKRSMTSIASYQVSPHTARIFKENERLIDKYKQKKLDYTKDRRHGSCPYSFFPYLSYNKTNKEMRQVMM